MTSDKIPIGKYIRLYISQKPHDFVDIKFKDGINIKDGDIITLDMIEPYESEAVRKVAEYIRDKAFEDNEFIIQYAREIVALVHEAEDADE
jgi:hypothetical protein